MSLQFKIKNLNKKEKQIFIDMLSKCLKLQKIHIDCIYDKNKTDKQVDFTWKKLIEAENNFRLRFVYLNMNSFTINDIKYCL